MEEKANHSLLEVFNLQLFAEGDPPVDPNPQDPPADPSADPPADPAPQDPPNDPPAPEPQKVKVKFNHEEKEITLEEAAQLAQKGMNYDKAIERAKQETAQAARDAFIADQGFTWKGKQIATEAEYKQALAERDLEEKLKTQDLPQEVIQEILEGRKDRQARRELESKLQSQQRFHDEISEMKGIFPELDPKTIPDEVWKLREQTGLPLLDAYNRIVMPQEIAKLRQALDVKETNKKNANASPGSVTGNGETVADFISRDTFEANKSNQRWVIKNLSKITASRPKW